jgi:hypothetical protein
LASLCGGFVMRADTLLSQIVHMVAAAQRSRAPIKRMADQVAGWSGRDVFGFDLDFGQVDLTIEGVQVGPAQLGDQRAIQRAADVPGEAVQALRALDGLQDDLGVGHHHEGVRAADGGLAHGDFSRLVQGIYGRPPRGQPMDAL